MAYPFPRGPGPAGPGGGGGGGGTPVHGKWSSWKSRAPPSHGHPGALPPGQGAPTPGQPMCGWNGAPIQQQGAVPVGNPGFAAFGGAGGPPRGGWTQAPGPGMPPAVPPSVWGAPIPVQDPDRVVPDLLRTLPRDELAREVSAALRPGEVPAGRIGTVQGVKTTDAKIGRRLAAGIKAAHCTSFDALAVGGAGAGGDGDDAGAECLRDTGWDSLEGAADTSEDWEEYQAARSEALRCAGIK